MFDPTTSDILSELENGEKSSLYLAEKLKISENEIRNKLSYLLEHNFVKENTNTEKTFYSVDVDKLAKIMEHDKNFEGIVDGLTEMDSFLN